MIKKKLFGIFGKKEPERKEKPSSPPVNQPVISSEQISSLENLSDETDSFDSHPEDIISKLAQINSIIGPEEEQVEEEMEEFFSEEEAVELAQDQETAEPAVAPSSDSIYISANVILKSIPQNMLADSLENLNSKYGSNGNFSCLFDKSELLYGLSIGKMEFKIGDLVDKLSFDAFREEISAIHEKTVELPLLEILPKIPPEWFAIRDQDVSREEMVTEMEDLFDPLQQIESEKVSTPEEPVQDKRISNESTPPPSENTAPQTVGEIVDHKDQQGNSVPESPISVQENRVPASESSVPAQESSVPAPESSVPAPESSVPAPESSVPAQESSVPAPESSVPAPESSVPAPESSSPVLESSAPIPPVESIRIEPNVPSLHEASKESHLQDKKENLASQGRTEVSPSPEMEIASEQTQTPIPTAPREEVVRDQEATQRIEKAALNLASEDFAVDKPSLSEHLDDSEPEAKPIPSIQKEEEIGTETNERQPVPDPSLEGPETAQEAPVLHQSSQIIYKENVSLQNEIEKVREIAEEFFESSSNEPKVEVREVSQIPSPTNTERLTNDWKSQAPNGIDINRAGIDELVLLNGVGGQLAQTIIEFRKKNGLFTQIQDLLKIPGLGPRTYRGMTKLSVRSELKTAECNINKNFGILSKNISLNEIAKVSLDLLGIDAMFISSIDGLILAKSSVNDKIMHLADSLAASAPQLYKRSKKTLKQAQLPAAEMFVSYIGKHCVTFSGTGQLFIVYLHKVEYPSQKQLKHCRKITADLVWYCSYRAVIS